MYEGKRTHSAEALKKANNRVNQMALASSVRGLEKAANPAVSDLLAGDDEAAKIGETVKPEDLVNAKMLVATGRMQGSKAAALINTLQAAKDPEAKLDGVTVSDINAAVNSETGNLELVRKLYGPGKLLTNVVNGAAKLALPVALAAALPALLLSVPALPVIGGAVVTGAAYGLSGLMAGAMLNKTAPVSTAIKSVSNRILQAFGSREYEMATALSGKITDEHPALTVADIRSTASEKSATVEDVLAIADLTLNDGQRKSIAALFSANSDNASFNAMPVALVKAYDTLKEDLPDTARLSLAEITTDPVVAAAMKENALTDSDIHDLVLLKLAGKVDPAEVSKNISSIKEKFGEENGTAFAGMLPRKPGSFAEAISPFSMSK
jgi:hypothetical protein